MTYIYYPVAARSSSLQYASTEIFSLYLSFVIP
jgi:hypothetical protein